MESTTLWNCMQGLPQVVCYLHDILISGKTDKEHFQNLEEVLARLEKFSLRGRLSKCAFFKDSVQFLGHTVNVEGIQLVGKKVACQHLLLKTLNNFNRL